MTQNPIANPNCELCPLHLYCTNVCVVPEYKEADLMVIIDNQTEESDLNNVFEINWSNKRYDLLKSLIVDVCGFDIERVYFTSAVKCKHQSKNRTPNFGEISECFHYLAQEIEQVKPKCILTFGAEIGKVVVKEPDATIQKLRTAVQDYEGTPVICSYALGYIDFGDARFPVEKRIEQIAEDINRAVNICIRSKYEGEFTHYKICKTLEDVEEIISYIELTKDCSFDIETTGLNFHLDEITTLSLSYQHGCSYVIPFYHFETPFSKEELEIIIDKLDKRVFNNYDVVKYAWNAKFDMKFLMYKGIKFCGKIHDGMVMLHLLDENRDAKFGLKKFSKEIYPQVADYDTEIKQTNWAEIPLETLCKYNAHDTDLTFRLCTKLESDLIKDIELYRVYRNECVPALYLLLDMEYTGMLIDKDECEKNIAYLNDRIEKIDAKLRELKTVKRFETLKADKIQQEAIQEEQLKLERLVEKAEEKDYSKKEKLVEKLNELEQLLEIQTNSNEQSKILKTKDKIDKLKEKLSLIVQDNITTVRIKDKIAKLKSGEIQVYQGINFNSPTQLSELLYSSLGYNYPNTIKVGGKYVKASTDKNHLSALDDKEGFIELLLEKKQAGTILNTYLLPIKLKLDDNNYVHPQFLQTGTTTGRLSCREPNLQNCPRTGEYGSLVKKMFIAPKGYKILQVDLSQAELRVAAILSKDQTMIDAYANNLDLHQITAMKTLNISQAEWDKMDKNERKEARSKAKAVNFGFLYGMGAEKFQQYALDSYKVVFTPKQSTEVRENFFKLYSSLQLWHATYKKYARDKGYVSTMFGRKRRLPDINNKLNLALLGEAERQAINSPVQGTAGEYTIFCACILKNRLSKDIKMVNTIHDSLILYVPETKIADCVKIIKETFNNPCLDKYFNFNMQPVGMAVDIEIGNNWKELIPYEN